VFRFLNDGGCMSKDVITLRDEQMVGASPLLEPVLQGGRVVGRLPTLEESKSLCREDLQRLPEIYKNIVDPARFPVKFSSELQGLREATEKKIRSTNSEIRNKFK
jgi:hypothetical protein